MKGREKRGVALFLAFLLIFQVISRGESFQASAVENSGQEMETYRFLVTESREGTDPDGEILVAGAKVQIIVSDRIKNDTEYFGKQVTAEDGSSIILKPGIEVANGSTNEQGKVAIQIPQGIPSQYCDYTITREGSYHSRENLSLEEAMPQEEIKAAIDWIPVFQNTKDLRISWMDKDFVKVLTDSKGNALDGVKYSITKLMNSENEEIAAGWIGNYVSVDEHTGKVTPGNLAELSEASVKLPMTVTIQGEKTSIIGQEPDKAEYMLVIDKVKDELKWVNSFEQNKLIYGTMGASLRAVSSHGAVKYEVTKGAEFLSINEYGEITYVRMPRPEEIKPGNVEVKAYTSSLYDPREIRYAFTLSNLEIDVNQLSIQGFQNDMDGQLQPVNLTYGNYRKSGKWFAGNSLALVCEGYQFSSTAEEDAQWEDTYDLTKVTPDDGMISAEFYVRENATGRKSDKLKVEGIRWDNISPSNLKITYAKPLWQQELDKGLLNYYDGKNHKLEVTLSAQDGTSEIAGFAWGHVSREGKGNSDSYKVVKADVSNRVKVENGVTSVTFEIDREDCMNLDFYAYDNAGNRSETLKDQETAVLLDHTEPKITIEYDNVTAKTYDGENYYNAARTATISIEEEHFTALQESQSKDAKGWVQATLTVPEKVEESPQVKIGGEFVSAGDVGAAFQNHDNWQESKKDGKIYHTIQITYSADAKYEFQIQAEDAAGNQSEVKEDSFWIDKTNPQQPEVTYSQQNNEKEMNGVLRKYYSTDMTVSIALQDALSGIEHMEWRENSAADWKQITSFEKQGDKAIARFTLKGEGNRTIAVKTYDKAGNCTEYTDSKTEIIIDSTSPEVKVSFNKAQAQNGKYFGEPRTAVITVNETNFDASRIVVKARAEDVTGKTISADTEIFVNGTSVKILELPTELKKDESWTYKNGVHQAEIVFSNDAGYQFDIQVQDLALLHSQEVKNTFCVDQKSPQELTVTYSESILEKILNKITFGYYKSHVMVKFSAEDITSGVNNLHWGYAKENGSSKQNVNSIEGDVGAEDLVFSKDGNQATYSVKLSAKKAQQYRGNISFTVTDKAGNSKTFRDKTNNIVVDNIAPTMTVSYTPINTAKNKAYFDGNALLNFEVEEANFYKEDVAVTINDEKASIRNWKQEKGTDKWKGTLSLKEDGDYKVKVSYQDRSGNQMKAKTEGADNSSTKTWTSPVLVVDTKNPIIKVTYDNTTPESSWNGTDYYDEKRTAVIQIIDKNFRANEVEAKVSAVTADGTSAAVRDYQAYLKRSENWRKTGDTYTARISYDVDANYTFDISYADMAKNQAKKYAQDKFTIDTRVPENLQISYSDSVLETVLENVSFGFYQARVTVTITAEDHTAGIDHFIYSYKKAENVSGINSESLEQRIEKAQIRYSNGKRIATAQFSIPQSELDANNQFNGTVEFTAVDNSNLQTVFTDNHRIVVDNIAPNADVTYNAPTTSANGTDYYADAVEGQIAVTEANFRAEDVQVSATKDGAPYILNVNWSDSGTDLHNGSFQLSEDGDYQISITYQDKSGNSMATYESNQITVDSTAPTVSIAEIADKTAYNKEVIGFKIDVDDANFDLSSFEPKLTGIVHEESGRFINKDFSNLGRVETVESGKRYEYVIDNITEDAIYTLSCAVKDLSLNATSEMNVIENSNNIVETVTFSVNRNGSTFMLDEPTRELVEDYYVQEVDESVVLQEVNCDPVMQHFITVNGDALQEDSQYLVRGGEEENAWYQYDYVIDKEVFRDEGEYTVIVSTKDKAENMAYSDIKNVETSFVVDHTNPVVTVSGLASNGRYQEEIQNVNVIPKDDGGKLDSLTITISDHDGGSKKTVVSANQQQLAQNAEKGNETIEFGIPQGIGQVVTISCKDAAENEYKQIYENITVSTEWYIMLLANRPLMLGIIGTTAAIIAAGTVVIVLRRKKKRIKA